LADAHRIAEYLIEQCEAAVFGIGSLFESGRVFGPRSDIDLVVEGIPPERFFSITAAAASLTSFDLDIIPLEEANELIRKRVDACGVQL
jgi:predicted nucleotidyltransferase